MSALSNSISGAVNYLLTIRISDFIDIIIVAYLIYKAIWFLRKTNSYNLAQGLLILLVVLWLSEVFRLTMINNLLRKAVELGLIALLILFQPELRRILERMGSSFHSGKAASSTAMDMAIAQTVLACSDMSASRTGALIIFERSVNLNNIMSTGTIINSDTTAELIKNISTIRSAVVLAGSAMVRIRTLPSLTTRKHTGTTLTPAPTPPPKGF